MSDYQMGVCYLCVYYKKSRRSANTHLAKVKLYFNFNEIYLMLSLFKSKPHQFNYGKIS